MKNIWKMSPAELQTLEASFVEPCPKQDIGDITVCCHTSNQAYLLPDVVATARSITDKIIVLDDCSEDDTRKVAFDLGCRVFSIPEGWIYTHGFGKLVEKQVQLCETGYHIQVDTGEKLWISPGVSRLTKDYYWLIRVNTASEITNPYYIQKMPGRLVRVGAPFTILPVIHGWAKESQQNNNPYQIILFHGDFDKQKDIPHYVDRKNRLYFKLLQKGVRDNSLHNQFWVSEYQKNEASYRKSIEEIENRIGILNETTEDIVEIGL